MPLRPRFVPLAAGPYKPLVIRNAMVVPGHGGPTAGPYDIVIVGNTIAEMIPFDPAKAPEVARQMVAKGIRATSALSPHATW